MLQTEDNDDVSLHTFCPSSFPFAMSTKSVSDMIIVQSAFTEDGPSVTDPGLRFMSTATHRRRQ